MLFLIVIFIALYSLIGITKYVHYQTGLDLAIYVQSFWYYLHGQLPQVTLFPTFGDLVWTDHFSPSLILFAPLYALWRDPKMLIFIQTTWLCLGAYPIFCFARQHLKHPVLAYAIALTYLLSFFVQFPLTFDVHLATFAAGFLPWILWAMETKRWGKVVILSLIMSGMKEDAAFYIAGLSLYLILTKKNIKLGLVSLLVSLSYIFLITKYVMPSLAVNTPKSYYTPYIEYTPSFLISVFLNDPVKIRTMLVSFLNFLFLPVLSGYFLILPLIHFFINFVSNDFPGRWDIYLHYRVYLGPIMAWAAIIGVSRFMKKFSRSGVLLAGVLLLNAVIMDYLLHLPLNTLTKRQFYSQEAWIGDNNAAIKTIPADAYLLSMNSLLPQVAFRQQLYSYPKNIEQAEYIVLDTRKNQPPTNFWLTAESESEFQQHIEELMNSPAFTRVYQAGEAVVWKRNWQIPLTEEE